MLHARPHRQRLLALWLACVCVSCMSPAARAADAYFVLVFAVQDKPACKTDKAHSFATFVRSSGDDQAHVEAFTLSWLPATLDTRAKRLRSEPGVNLDLPATLSWAWERGLTVLLWGPYQIDRELYDEARQQHAHLASGQLRWKAVDSGFRAAEVSNCVHVLTDLVLQTPHRRLGTPCWGPSASYFVVLAMTPWLLEPERTHDWLLDKLGLADAPIERQCREAGNPNPQRLYRAIQDAIYQKYLERGLKQPHTLANCPAR